MKCRQCFDARNGTYNEIEDFNPGSEYGEWTYYQSWTCLNCGWYIYSYEEGFIYEDK